MRTGEASICLGEASTCSGEASPVLTVILVCIAQLLYALDKNNLGAHCTCTLVLVLFCLLQS